MYMNIYTAWWFGAFVKFSREFRSEFHPPEVTNIKVGCPHPCSEALKVGGFSRGTSSTNGRNIDV